MEFSEDKTDAQQIKSYSDQHITVNETRYEQSIIVSEQNVSAWAVKSFAEISLDTLKPALALQPDVILLGTGTKQQFVKQELIANLAAERIGLEAMSTPAACRTFNVLVSEGREVVAALLLD